MTKATQLPPSDDLRQRLLTVVGSIPAGKVCTYGQIAALAGAPRHARMVGSLLKKLPKDSRIPWHRVINHKGTLSFPDHSPAFLEQKRRLEEEGVVMINNRYDLKRYGWRP